MPIASHTYKYSKVVVGGSISALKYAYNNRIPIIIIKSNPPRLFEEGRKTWNQLVFSFSLSGLCISFTEPTYARIVDENRVKIILKNTKEINIIFEKIFFFDDANVHGLDPPAKTEHKKKIIDWIRPISCAPHDFKKIQTNDDFVSEINFYPKRCISGKAIAVVSYLTQEQLKDYRFTDTYTKFKTLSIMKEKGIRGSYNGLDRCGKKIFYNLKIDVERRDVEKVKMDFYEDTDTFSFIYSYESDILESNDYLKNVSYSLDIHGTRATNSK